MVIKYVKTMVKNIQHLLRGFHISAANNLNFNHGVFLWPIYVNPS